MLKELKTFIMRGSVLDLAVAVIIATYFGNIINSLVNDLLMPVIGKLIGGVDFSQFKFVIQEGRDAVVEGDSIITPALSEVAIFYGTFINHLVTFLIVAFAIFMMLKAYKKTRKPKETPAPSGPTELDLLKEIRDALKK